MAKVTAADIAHLIDFQLQHQAIRPAYRPFLLAYIASGYDQDGNRIQRAEAMESRIKTLECEIAAAHHDKGRRAPLSAPPSRFETSSLATPNRARNEGKTRPTPPRA